MPGKDVCGGSSDIFLFYLQRGRYIMDSSTYDIVVYHGGNQIGSMFCDWSAVRKRGKPDQLDVSFWLAVRSWKQWARFSTSLSFGGGDVGYRFLA
jgi:hypothetical protein